ncbi:MAG: CpsD/CapB family tyrosine-protein kinase [Thermodesulfovibrionales bacterium]|nr:CpsD/CapB family tyrosine-protein kinase [Thermodesulfovibrionales bacterium]
MDILERAFNRVLKEKKYLVAQNLEDNFSGDPQPVVVDLNNVSPYVVSLIRPDSFESEQFRKLKARIFKDHAIEENRTLLVTSPDAGAGKSLVALNLSVSLALSSDFRILLIDADLKHPSIHHYLGINENSGLSHYLEGSFDLSKIIMTTNIGNLDIVFCGKDINDRYLQEKMKIFIQAMKRRYQYIILDSPPILSSADTIQLAFLSEAVLLVINDKKTTKNSVRQALSLLNKERIIGIVLNCFPSSLIRIKYPYYFDGR